MDTHDTSSHLCHRCQKPMERISVDVINDEAVEVFRCENCDTLEAVKLERVT